MERMMLTRGPSTLEKQEYFNKLRDAVDPSRTDITSWADLQDLEERTPRSTTGAGILSRNGCYDTGGNRYEPTFRDVSTSCDRHGSHRLRDWTIKIDWTIKKGS